MEWKTPAFETPVARADRVELLCLPAREIVTDEGWPDTLWPHVRERHLLVGHEARRVIRLFQDLEPGDSARCHEPPWGLAFYEGESLLFTTTLCFLCSNAYVHMPQGMRLRAFDVEAPSAAALREVLERHLPISE